jgi:hypothetical protein
MEKPLENIFRYHPPKDDQPKRYETIRSLGHGFAEAIENLCPPSAERDEAIKKIREAVMWANASIACNE